MIFNLKDLENKFPLMNFDFIKDDNLLLIIKTIKGKFVGGIVRDSLLGIKTYDIDIATNLLANEVMELMQKLQFNPIGTGIQYGTISIFLKTYKIEITTLRKDIKTFGRRAEVVFGGSWEEDSTRRDFTFNSLYLDINNNIYDYHNGIEDLLNKKVKFIGDYKQRIKEDYLRIMRFIRFYLRYGNNQMENYMNEIQYLLEFVEFMNLLSIERILMEINSILKLDKWDLGIKILNELKISYLFFQKDLFIPIVNDSIQTFQVEEKFIIIFHNIDIKIIEKLPIEKNIKNDLKIYIESDWSLKYLSKIFYKTKNFHMVSYYLAIWHFININNKDKYMNELLNTFISNKKLINFNEEFNIYKNSYTYINQEGPLRGEEEINMRINFLKKYME